MKNILFTLVFVQIVHIFGTAQSFSYHSTAPFGIVPVKADTSRSAIKLMFYDFDQDEDLDLFMSGLDFVEDELLGWGDIHFFFEMQENIGDRFLPAFSERRDAFDDFPFPAGLFFPALGDVNGDGNGDVIMNGDIDFIGNVIMLSAINTGTQENPEFEVTRADTLGLDLFVPESFFDPALVDLDSDGDLDILMSGFDPAFAEEDGPDIPQFYYAKNFGTSAGPDFRGWYSEPYGLKPDTLSELTAVGDIDNDGDMDVVGTGMKMPADSVHTIKVHLNTPNQGKPGFGEILQSPFGLPVSHGEEQFSFPNLVDLDGDGDLDLFLFKLESDGTTTLEYYENSLCTVTTDEVFADICEGESFDFEGHQYTQAGTYEIHTVGTDGCAKVILLHLTILVSPVTDVEETICAGEVYTIGGMEFEAAGDYHVTLVDANGCDSIVLLHLTVIDVDNSVSLTENILTANQSGASYQWLNCDTGADIPGANGQSYEVPATGNYAVRITDANDCTRESECVFVVITGTHDRLYAGLIEIYPNPTDRFFSIRNETAQQVNAVELISASGKSVLKSNWNEHSILDISALPRGVYIATLQVAEHRVIRRLIIQ